LNGLGLLWSLQCVSWWRSFMVVGGSCIRFFTIHCT